MPAALSVALFYQFLQLLQKSLDRVVPRRSFLRGQRSYKAVPFAPNGLPHRLDISLEFISSRHRLLVPPADTMGARAPWSSPPAFLARRSLLFCEQSVSVAVAAVRPGGRRRIARLCKLHCVMIAVAE